MILSGLQPYSADEAPELPFFTALGGLDVVVLERLLEHPLRLEQARLPGFEMSELDRFSTLVRSERGSVEGLLIRDLAAEDLRRIDAYGGVGEGLYRRVAVVVDSGAGERTEQENAYVHLPTAKTTARR